MSTLDPRLHAFRTDLADISLKGKVEANRFVNGENAQISVPVAKLYQNPNLNSGIDTEILIGEKIKIFDEAQDFCWIQAEQDGYVGYVQTQDLRKTVKQPTHVVNVPRTFVYAEPDLRKPVQSALSLGSEITLVGEAETRGSHYGLLSTGGSIFLDHVVPVNSFESDYVSVAESLLRTPYLWGGASAFGIDCSGLVQLALARTGVTVLRDTDMQEKSIGVELDKNVSLKRGDLVFWKGHVAIMVDEKHIIHANGASMDVKIELLEAAIERIARLYAQPTSYRRIK